jgi:hypothetical protein
MTVAGGWWDTKPITIPTDFTPLSKIAEEYARERMGSDPIIPMIPDPKILLKCPRCFITFDPADTIVTWEEILEPGKGPAKKHITRGAIRMESLPEGMKYTCGVCGNEWTGEDPGPMNLSALDHIHNEPAVIFHEGHDHPVGAVSHHFSE